MDASSISGCERFEKDGDISSDGEVIVVASLSDTTPSSIVEKDGDISSDGEVIVVASSSDTTPSSIVEKLLSNRSFFGVSTIGPLFWNLVNKCSKSRRPKQ